MFNFYRSFYSLVLLKTYLIFLSRYKYENDRVVDAASPDASSPLPYQVYGNGKAGTNLSTKGTYNQLLERQVNSFSCSQNQLSATFFLLIGKLSVICFYCRTKICCRTKLDQFRKREKDCVRRKKTCDVSGLNTRESCTMMRIMISNLQIDIVCRWFMILEIIVSDILRQKYLIYW